MLHLVVVAGSFCKMNLISRENVELDVTLLMFCIFQVKPRLSLFQHNVQVKRIPPRAFKELSHF